MSKTKTKTTKDAPSALEAFIAEVEGEQPERVSDDLPMVIFERDEIHAFTVQEYTEFEGQYGPSVCVIGEDAEGTKIKTFFNGYERESFSRWVEGVELPQAVRLARRLVDSEKNPGRTYAALYLKSDD